MRIAALVFGLGVLLTTGERASGISAFIPLSPANIHSSYSFILVRSSTHRGEANIRHFRVVVQPTQEIAPANFGGSLCIIDASSNLVARCTVVPRRLPQKSKDVAEGLHELAVVFEFEVASQFLEHSKFYVTDQPQDVPAFTSYWFRLRDYAELEGKAEPDGAANRSQPIRAETNRTSEAAGSDR